MRKKNVGGVIVAQFVDEFDDEGEMEDYDFDNDFLEFDPLYYPAPISYLERLWQRPLEYYEKYLVAEVYNWVRHNIDVEEVRLIELPIDPSTPLDTKQVVCYTDIHHNEPIIYLSEQWHRPLTNHEMHIIIAIYDWSRTQLELEEVMFIADLWGGQAV